MFVSYYTYYLRCATYLHIHICSCSLILFTSNLEIWRFTVLLTYLATRGHYFDYFYSTKKCQVEMLAMQSWATWTLKDIHCCVSEFSKCSCMTLLICGTLLILLSNYLFTYLWGTKHPSIRETSLTNKLVNFCSFPKPWMKWTWQG